MSIDLNKINYIIKWAKSAKYTSMYLKNSSVRNINMEFRKVKAYQELIQRKRTDLAGLKHAFAKKYSTVTDPTMKTNLREKYKLLMNAERELEEASKILAQRRQELLHLYKLVTNAFNTAKQYVMTAMRHMKTESVNYLSEMMSDMEIRAKVYQMMRQAQLEQRKGNIFKAIKLQYQAAWFVAKASVGNSSAKAVLMILIRLVLFVTQILILYGLVVGIGKLIIGIYKYIVNLVKRAFSNPEKADKVVSPRKAKMLKAIVKKTAKKAKMQKQKVKKMLKDKKQKELNKIK